MIAQDIFKKIPNEISPGIGKILIADPFDHELEFKRAVILITEHNQDGTVGFVLNKPTDVIAENLIDDVLSFKGNLYFGGPVQTSILHYIHTFGDKIPDSIKITKSVYWSGNFETLKLLINSGIANHNNVKFFIGYSGWDPDQLDMEINEHSWIVSDIDDRTIMSANSVGTWNRVLSRLGGKYKIWSNFPVNPLFN
ncbi:MAG: YqgE/AlgH family protein [Marinilabiliaceae bacterium]|nr:YqgE/AlgH family protein [Marinilabiliaceae bacterium]